MHAVIRRYKIDPKNVDEVIRLVETGLVPLISKADGFVSYRAGLADNGDAISVSHFESAAQAEASVHIAASWVKDNLAQLLPNPPEIISGEVRVRQVNPGETLNYGVMREYQIDPSAVDELARRVEAEFVPIVSKVPGFAAYGVVDAGGGKVISLSGFRDHASADASTAAAATWVKEHAASILPSAPQVTTVELRVSKTQ